MNNITLIKRLENININCKNNDITSLIEELKKEALIEDFKGLSTKQRLNKCLNYSKKLVKKCRPILAYTCNDQIKGYQCFCDSYFMVALNEEDKTPIADYKEIDEKWSYPSLAFLNNEIKNYNSITFTCKLDKLLNYAKVNTCLKLINSETGFDNCIAYETLEMFVTFMNLKPNDTITLIAKSKDFSRPIYVKKDNGTYGFIMPIRNGDYHILKEEDL